MAHFGFILNQSPGIGENIETLYNLASAALEKKHQVFIYLNYDGVFSPLKYQKPVRSGRKPDEMLGDLINKGADVMCSDLDIRIRGIESHRSLLEGVKTGSLSDVSEVLASADRLITL